MRCPLAVLMLFAAFPALAAEPILAFKNATIHNGIGEPILAGTLIVQDGKIVAIGKDVAIPAGATTTDLKGAVIIPGLVDTHSHIGIYPKPAISAHQDGNEMSGPVQSGVRALDSIDPNDPGIRMAVAGGITTANIMPGSGNVIGGQTLYVKLYGNSVEQMRILGKLPDGTEVLGGLKMANGENPKGYGKRGQAPFTRMKVAALQREQFLKAKEYLAKLGTDKKPDRDLSLEPLVEVLQKKRTVHFHCHRADDLMTALRIAEEFGFEIVLQHGTEGYRIADILAKKSIPVSLTLVESPGGKAEVMGLLEETAAILDKAGVPVCINTDDFITESRFYLKTGAIAVRGGMSEAAALRAMTTTAAKVLHIDHRVGSLEKGKDADFVVLTGSPFSVYTKVQQTWIDGVKRFDASDVKDRSYRDGGLWLSNRDPVPTLPEVVAPKPATAPAASKKTDMGTAKTFVLSAGRIHTGTGPPIENGVIIVENGLIKTIGPRASTGVPANAPILTARELSPGLIDPHTVAGLSGAWNIPADQDQDETSDPNQADLRVLDGFNPTEPLMEFLRANGISIIHATPGRAAVIAGQSGVFRTDARTVESAAIKPVAGILINLGETPKEVFKDKGPKTRMGVAALVRKAFAEAQSYKLKKDATSAVSPKHEALLPALAGTVPVYFAAHRADDILTALRISDEFKLKPILVLATDGYLVADELAKRKVPVIVHPTTQRPGGSMETRNSFLGNAAALQAKGVSVTICTSYEGYVPKQRNLRLEAGVAAANGLGHEGAMRAITIDAAKLLGIADKYGSIEVGKVADIVLYDGDPFEPTTHVTHTILDGKLRFDRSEYLKLPFERRILPIISGGGGIGCCLGIW